MGKRGIIMEIIIDNREKHRKHQAKNYYLQKYNNTPKIRTLPTADYTFTENNTTTAYEYKEIRDYLKSINDKTVFQEISNQTQNPDYDYNYLIIEGDLMETLRQQYKIPNIRRKYPNYKHYLESHIRRYQGATRRCRTILGVITTPNQTMAFEEMIQQSLKCSHPKKYAGIVRQKNKYDLNTNPLITYLSGIRDIGEVTAENVVKHTQSKTLTDLTRLTHEDLIQVPGVGEKTAQIILQWL